MKGWSIPSLLLGFAAGATALNQTAALNQTTASTLAALNWPKIEAIGTYHAWDDLLLADAAACLADWCDSDLYVRRSGGKVRCRTPGDSGAEVFICNAYGKQRCSSINIAKAVTELREAGYKTGAVNFEPAEGSGFLYGFEHFCKGNDCKNGTYDAVDAHCDREKYRFRSKRIQYDGIAKKRRVDQFKYKGTTWLEKPTPRPVPEYVHDYATFRTTTTVRGAAPKPTPKPSYNDIPDAPAPSVEAFTQFVHAYTTRARPPQNAQGPTSYAIVPRPTGVPGA